MDLKQKQFLECEKVRPSEGIIEVKMEVPEVVKYMDYRDYLRDFYNFKKSSNPHYSYRVFINKGQLGSPSHLKMVIDGKRNLTTKTIPKYIKALGLAKKQDVRYFELLVKYNQSQSLDEKSEILQEILLEKKKKGLNPIDSEAYDFLRKWYAVAIYVLIDLENFNPDQEWISNKLRKRISKKQVHETLEGLLKLGLIEGNPQQGFKQTKGALTTPDDVRSVAIHQYHKSMIELANDSLINDTLESREFNGVTFSIPTNRLSEIKNRIREFRREINELASSMDSPNDVYQLNIQLFPLTEEKL